MRALCNIDTMNWHELQIDIYFLQNKNSIKEIVLKVKSDNDYVLLGLKTNISEEDFNKIIEDSNISISSL